MTDREEPKEGGISKWKLALGAASLFFFVVGVKRSFRTEDGQEIHKSDADRFGEPRKQKAEPAPPTRRARR